MMEDDDGWDEEIDPDDPQEPCHGRSCETQDCHHDDCFIRRRMMGYPDMQLPIDLMRVPMSEKVSEALAWLMTEEGQEAALLDRWLPTGGGGGGNMEDFNAFRNAKEAFEK